MPTYLFPSNKRSTNFNALACVPRAPIVLTMLYRSHGSVNPQIVGVKRPHRWSKLLIQRETCRPQGRPEVQS
jgi:hypothetical protein